MNSCELVLTISSLACAIANCCDREEIALMATAFSQLGDTLATILAHDEFCENKNAEKKPETDDCPRKNDC